LVPGSAPARRLEAELAVLASTRERDARKRHDAAAAFRARVLLAQLARFRGAASGPLAAPAVELEYEPREARLAAEVLAPGPSRARAALRALQDPADPRGTARRELALAVAREEFQARHLEGADALAFALAGDPADLEAGLLWLRCESLAGRAGEAARQAFERGSRAAPEAAIEFALLEGELSLAQEAPGAARRALGRALALGSNRAMVALAWREFEEGQGARAAGLSSRCLQGSPALPPGERARAWTCFALAQLPSYKADSLHGSPRTLGRAGSETQP